MRTLGASLLLLLLLSVQIVGGWELGSCPCRLPRRTFLARISAMAVATIPSSPSLADNNDLGLAQPMGPNGRPFAPVEYLLPAARVGVYIYQSLSVAQDILQNEPRSKERIAKLDKVLLSPPAFITSKDPSVSRGDQYGRLPIVGEIGVAAQKQKEREERAIQVGLAPRLFEVGELMGERRQWNQLQTSERKREASSEIRRALNIYTTNLNFSRTQYQWVGTADEKRQLIRKDRLPSTNEVIRSDLDARDLYRNQVQTALDDAIAEWNYQKTCDTLEVTELVELLEQAKTSIDQWFAFVPEEDVRLALETVRNEGILK